MTPAIMLLKLGQAARNCVSAGQAVASLNYTKAARYVADAQSHLKAVADGLSKRLRADDSPHIHDFVWSPERAYYYCRCGAHRSGVHHG